MDEQPDTVQLEQESVGGGKFKVTARWRGDVVHIDRLDPASAIQRKRFIKGLHAALPQADGQAIDTELLKTADTSSATPQTPADADELDISRIVRPEQFITPDVCGLVVPVISNNSSKPVGRWTLYLRWRDGRRECRDLCDHIELDDGLRLWIHPMPGDPSVTTASAWSAAARRAWLEGKAAPNPADLFKRICERIAYFIDLPDDVAAGTTATLALWTILSYAYQAWDAVPYLYVGGPVASGKTRVFEIESRLVYRPLQSSNLTAPALFRTLHDRGGAVLFDEAERLRQSTPEIREIMSILLAGYKRGGQAMRLEPVGDTFRSVAFEVYGPKAVACISGLPPVLSSRCITVMMFRAGPDSPKPKRRIDGDRHAWQALRDDLHALALEYGPTWLDLAQRSDVCHDGINGRVYELWQPLLALAWWVESHGAGGLLALMQRHALASVITALDDQIPEADEILLEILTAEVQRGYAPTPGEILDKAKERDIAAFERWIPQTVTRRLKAYGVGRPRKSNGARRYRDVTLDQLRGIQWHYGIDLEITDGDRTPKSSTLIDPINPKSPLIGAGERVDRVDKGR